MDADVVMTASSDNIGSGEDDEASAMAVDPDDSFHCGDNSSQTRSKRRRISPPASQQKEDAIMTTSDKDILLAHATRYKKEALEKRISNGKRRALEKRKKAEGKAAVESPWLQWRRASSDEDSFSLADSSSDEEMDYGDSDADTAFRGFGMFDPLEDDEEASRAAQSADAAFGPLEVDVDAPPVAPDDGNDYHCSKCKLFGDLICCDMCPKTYHRGCLPSGSSLESVDNDGDWFCPACLAISAIPSSIPVVSTDEEMGDTDSITGSTADLDDD